MSKLTESSPAHRSDDHMRVKIENGVKLKTTHTKLPFHFVFLITLKMTETKVFFRLKLKGPQLQSEQEHLEDFTCRSFKS